MVEQVYLYKYILRLSHILTHSPISILYFFVPVYIIHLKSFNFVTPFSINDIDNWYKIASLDSATL